jgi:2,4-dienoyl-CoA reductase-like NADH-dependent reductase (Old Yellow Enzyme family)
MPTLFDPITIGDLTLKNRVIMAPLTRARAIGGGRVPNALMAKYYEQRASAGLILSEATAVTPQGVGYADTPGLWSDEQVEGWKQVTAAVHAKGGVIFAQLWHVGRISDPSFLNGEPPVSASAIAAEGHVSLLRPQRPYPVPRALETAEIPASSLPTRRPPKTPRKPASTAWKSTAPTATCWTSSCNRKPTSAPTSTAARLKTVPA